MHLWIHELRFYSFDLKEASQSQNWNLRDAGPGVEREGEGAVQDGRRRPSPGMWPSRLFDQIWSSAY